MQCHPRPQGIVHHGNATGQPLVDLLGQPAELAAKVRAGASGAGKVAVLGKVAAGVAGVVEAILQCGVALADVHAQFYQRLQRCIRDMPLPANLVVGNLHGNGPVVVGRAAAAPTAVCLVAQQRNTAVTGNRIVAGHLAAGLGLHGSNLLQRQIARHVVRGDFADSVLARAVAVG